MRILLLSLAMVVMFCSPLHAQDNSNPPPRPDQQQQPEQQQRPTLGKRAPANGETSPEGPHTASVTDERKLMRIRTIYVDQIDNRLSDRLTEGLAKMGRFRIVTQRKEADAVLSGTCFDSRRLKQLHSEVFLNDRASGSSIWQDIVRRPYNPPSLAESVQDSADVIVAHLGQTIQAAERK